MTGDEFRRVTLCTDPQRGGVLTQASILTVTSNPNRTSPVKRGRWVLEQLLGTPPPPPPPEVDAAQGRRRPPTRPGSLRQRMEQHRSNPSCAVCHDRMDPLGFGLENYDGVGAWRDQDGGIADRRLRDAARGRIVPGPGRAQGDPQGPRREFARCLTEKMLTYALGRGLEDPTAAPSIGSSRTCAGNDYRFSTLVLEIVWSDPFLKRRYEPAGTGGIDDEQRDRISRRTVLRGLGRPSPCPGWRPCGPAAGGRRTAGPRRPPARMAFLYVPNGVHMADWTPADDGHDFELAADAPSRSQPFQDDLLVLSGLTQNKARAHRRRGRRSRPVAGRFLTGVTRSRPTGPTSAPASRSTRSPPRRSATRTRFAFARARLDPAAQAGNCDSGYSCAYSSNISWKSATLADGQGDQSRGWSSTGSSAQRRRRLAGRRRQRERRRAEHPRLRRARTPGSSATQLGTNDRRKIDEYLNRLREIERRIERAAPTVDARPARRSWPGRAGSPRTSASTSG